MTPSFQENGARAKNFVFISYAWGDASESKKWLSDVAFYLECCGYSVFWDRDSIPFGETIFDGIGRALNSRPIDILCFCDEDYIKSAKKEDAGVFIELKMIAEIAKTDGVRVIPLIFNEALKQMLPPLLEGRICLNLTSLLANNLRFGPVIASVIDGATQREISELISEQIFTAKVKHSAGEYLQKGSLNIYGDPSTHEVTINHSQPLLPAKWMLQSRRWSSHLRDHDSEFDPQRGIWHWDHYSPGTAMQAFGTALCTAFFPDDFDDKKIIAIERCGVILAENVISMTKKYEPFIFDWREFLECILKSDGGATTLSKLLVN